MARILDVGVLVWSGGKVEGEVCVLEIMFELNTLVFELIASDGEVEMR